jgi:5,10-methylenetetrahydromethanopterin reductase
LSDISVSCDGRDSLRVFREKVAAGELGGARTMWIANHLFQRDPVSLSAMSLAQTQRMGVALMAVSPFTMHPVQAAMAAATLDEAFPGRVTLCLGVGAPADLKALGIGAQKPVRAMREALETVRALLDGERVRVEGETFRANGRRLAGGAHAIPLVLAASGSQMLELGGAVADGVLISAGAAVEFVVRTLEHVQRGAKGRAVRTYGLVYASVDDEESRAYDRLRRILAIVLRGTHHGANLALAGSVLDQTALNEAVLAEDWPRAESLVTDEIVRRHAASGNPEQVCARLARYHAAGLDEIVIAGAQNGQQIAQLLKAN